MPTDEEVKAAAERWNGDYPTIANNYGCNKQLHDDACILADEYVRNLQAVEKQAEEDAKPVTEEWLIDNGFQRTKYDDPAGGDWIKGRVAFDCENAGISVRLLGNNRYWSIVGDATTGQLLHLMAALGGE